MKLQIVWLSKLAVALTMKRIDRWNVCCWIILINLIYLWQRKLINNDYVSGFGNDYVSGFGL